MDGPHANIPKRTGKNAPRSKNGCWTCRGRHVKCDETKPICHVCAKRNLECDYTPKRREKNKQKATRKLAPRPAQPVDASPVRSLELLLGLPISPYTSPSPSSSIYSPSSSYRRKKDFLNFLENDAPRSVDPFFSTFWPFKISLEESICIYNFCTNFDTASTKSYKFCFHAGMVLVSSLSPMLARLILALALAHGGKESTVAYYNIGISEFIQLLRVVDKSSASDSEIIFVLVAMWLMVQYEHQFGDNTVALDNHLRGFKAFIESRARKLLLLDDASSGEPIDSVLIEDQIISGAIVSKLVLWTAYHDAISSTFGVGGELIRLAPQSYLETLNSLHLKSLDATKEIWQEAYPYEQLYDDALNHDILKLHYHSLMVRLLASDLQAKWLHLGLYDEQRADELEAYVHKINNEFSSVFQPSPQIGSAYLSDRYRANLNCLGAMFSSGHLLYLAVILDLKQDSRGTIKSQMENCIQLILRFAATIEATEGVKALYRIAFPLFICALESSDMIHQSWIMIMLEQLAPHGKNAVKARQCLESMRGKGWMVFARSKYFCTFVL